MVMGTSVWSKKVVATKIVAVDGTGDFTDIATAIAALPAEGGVVYLKEGEFVITEAISITKSNVALMGAGKSTKISTTGNHSMISASSKSGLLISDIWLYGAGSGHTSNKGIDFHICSGFMIDRCWIENCGSVGIEITSGTQGSNITNCLLSDNVGRGIYATGSNIIISNNVLEDGLSDGIVIYTAHSIIANNVIDTTSGIGIKLWSATFSIVEGNEVTKCQDEGLSIDAASYNNIVGNFIHGNYIQAGGGPEIFMEDLNLCNQIVGNVINDSSGTAIVIDDTDTRLTNIQSNSIYNYTTAALSDGGTDTNYSHNHEDISVVQKHSGFELTGDIEVKTENVSFGSNEDINVNCTAHASSPVLNVYPAGGALTSSRMGFRCVEGVGNHCRFQGCTGTTAALSSSNTMGIIEFVCTQADPNALMGAIKFWVNKGDSVGVRAMMDDTGYFGLGVNMAAPVARLHVDTDTTEGREAIHIQQDDADKAFIDYEGTSAANTANNITTYTAGNSIQGFVRIEINGTDYWMPYYDAPSS